MNLKSSYKTKQRENILNCLVKYKHLHVTVDDISGYLKAEGVSVGKTTIYRYLDKLANEDIVHKYNMPKGESTCYQFCENKESHDNSFHLKCECCGKLIHLECEDVTNFIKHIEVGHNFKINKFKTVFYGICNECSKNK